MWGATGLVVYNGEAYLLGPATDGQEGLELHRWNPIADQWSLVAHMEDGDAHDQVVLHDGRLITLGGADDDGGFYRSTASLYVDGFGYTRYGGLSYPRRGSCAVLLHDELFVLGGESINGRSATQDEILRPFDFQ